MRGQSIESQYGSNAILDGSSRNADTGSHAKCLDEEINTGRAIEMSSLTVKLEGSDVRLDWSPPYSSDRTAPPNRY